MESLSQHTAIVTKGGGPTKPRADAEVKADSPDAADSPANSKDATESLDNKRKKNAKKNASDHKLKRKDKKNSKKKRVTTDDSSSSSSDNDLAESDMASEDSDLEVVVPRKYVTKKGQDALRLKMDNKTKKHKSPAKTRSRPTVASGSDPDSSDSDLESSSDEAEDAEPVVGKRKSSDRMSKQDIGIAVAREVQRIFQLAQTRPSTSAVPGQTGYGAGLNSGLGAGLSGTGYPILSGLQSSYPSNLGNQGRPSRGAGLDPGGARDALDDRLALLGTLNDPLGADRGARRRGALGDNTQAGDPADSKKQKPKKPNYKRVDQVWDNTIHNFKLQDTAASTTEKQYSGFCFHVRRTFDWEGKYKATVVDIKSKLLRECLQDVMGNIKGVSLVDETPKLDPNMLFLYLEDLRKHLKVLKSQVASPPGSDKAERKKEAKRLEEKRQHLKILVKYIDKDYEHIKKSLYPMLEHGLITFDLLWALWKPNTLAYTATYGSHDEPRVFKVDTAEKHYHISKGEFYFIDGKVRMMVKLTRLQ